MLSTEMGVLDSRYDSYPKGSDGYNFSFRSLGASCFDAVPSFILITVILIGLNVRQKGLIDTCCVNGVGLLPIGREVCG
jgi:hypothetical protein